MTRNRTFAVTNQKGGVGKTTSAINLCASLAATKRRVLLVDLDSQGNATMGSGVNKYEVELSAYDVLTDMRPISDVIQASPDGAYDLVPGNSDLTAAEVQLLDLENREFRLSFALSKVQDQYEYIIIDCPPSLNMLTVNALVAAHGVLIPVQCEYFALEGLSGLMATVERVQQNLNANLKIEGILRTMYDPRNSLTRDVSQQLLQHFNQKVYRTVIPRNVRVAEAPSFGQPVLAYDRQSKGALAYLAMAGEMLRRHEQEDSLAVEAENSADNSRENGDSFETGTMSGNAPDEYTTH
ncbi:MAG: ParA family protein [Pseudomonadota bacterium]